MISKGRGGHQVVRPSVAAEIATRARTGEPVASLAAEFGVAIATVYTWKYRYAFPNRNNV
jgi:hypothetical protein